MTKKSIDLAAKLPNRYRDKTIDTFLENVIEPMLTRDETELYYGFVGTSSADSLPGDIYLNEVDLERKLNQLQPFYHATVATEERLLSWADIVQRLVTLGVSYSKLSSWLDAGMHNFLPPINLDKFCNYGEYVWVGPWIAKNDTVDYSALGIPTAAAVQSAFSSSGNPSIDPEYYLIERGPLSGQIPTSPYPGASWSAWSLCNLWVHKDDAIAFANSNPTVDLNLVKSSKRPIIEISSKVRLTAFVDADGAPADSGTAMAQKKFSKNQPPQFDLYRHTGEHAKVTSSLFFFKESQSVAVDPVLGRRVLRNKAADYIFSHGYVMNDSLLWTKVWNGSTWELQTLWSTKVPTPVRCLKFEETGTLLNADKLTNYQSYYWTGVAQTSGLPSWNPTGEPEYSVIEAGGTSGWSAYNYWKHAADLNPRDLHKYHRATKPIIEFNVGLETELLGVKTALNQLPKFKLYSYNQGFNYYEALPNITALFLNDSYTGGVLFSRLADLSHAQQLGLTSTPELLVRQTTLLGDERFVSSLPASMFTPTNGTTTYGFNLRELERSGVGNGVASAGTHSLSAVPQVITLTALTPTTFSAVGTTSGILPTVTVGTPTVLAGASFTILPGTTAFVTGDTIYLELRSVVLERRSIYVKLGSTYRTFTSADAMVQSDVSASSKVATTTVDGAWELPAQLRYNINSLNGEALDLSEGDLITHFSSIIAAQQGLVGPAIGRNNWRNLTVQAGLGGIIKQSDQRFPLLIGLLAQEKQSVLDLLEFSSLSYDRFINKLREYVENELFDNLRDVQPAGGSLSIDSKLVEQAIKFAEQDETFASSTMPIKALGLTLPYLGLSAPTLPKIMLDPELNIMSLRHHDGHMSPLAQVDDSIFKQLVQKLVLRSNGQITPGRVSGPVAPDSPFARELWLNLSEFELNFYDVLNDVGDISIPGRVGQYVSNRATGEVWQMGASWVSLGSSPAVQLAPWRRLDLSKTLQELLLAVEQRLFTACPPLATRVNVAALKADAEFTVSMQKSFERFAKAQGVHPYIVQYSATNPFTWSYKGSAYPGSSDPAAWQVLYNELYGTSRPDIEPWISTGYASEATFLAAAIAASVIPPGTTSFVPATHWPTAGAWIKSKYLALGRPTQLSVNTTTGALLPPYSFGHAEQLLASPPPTPLRAYLFGERGPIELAWTRTTAYQTALQVAYFRVDPLTYVTNLWGERLEVINGYQLATAVGRKRGTDVPLHGDVQKAEKNPFTIMVNSIPGSPETYSFEVISAIDRLLKVKYNGNTSFVSYNAPFTIGSLSVTTDVPILGLHIGTKLTLKLSADDGSLTEEYSSSEYLALEGYGQLFVQLLAANGKDVTVEASANLLRNWGVKYGYRTGRIIDSSLKVKYDLSPAPESSYRVVLKENKLSSSASYSALKVTLLRRGSTEARGQLLVPATASTGSPGDDWLFKVDTYGPTTKLRYYSPATDGRVTFFALNSSKTKDEWTRPAKGTLTTTFSPLIITGIQALADFIFGHSYYLDEVGFKVTGSPELPLDPTFARPRDWQLLVEQFIDQQFSGVDSGSAFLFDPYQRKLIFSPAAGLVSEVAPVVSTTSTYSNILSATGVPLSARVFRTADITTASTDQPISYAKLITSKYEHVILIDNVPDSTLVYDPFLGQSLTRLFVSGRTGAQTWRPDLAGRILHHGQYVPNMEAATSAISKLYDTGVEALSDKGRERAKALLGYSAKAYQEKRNMPELTGFRFWQGAIKAKGTNKAIEAFTNAKTFRTASVDEYWVYKLSEYGDARAKIDVELKLRSDDSRAERTNLLFLEDDEQSQIDTLYTSGGYDIPPYDIIPYDVYTLYTSEQAQIMEPFDPRGCVMIRPRDESRWFRYDELGALQYLEADLLAEVPLLPSTRNKCYRIVDRTGKPVRADAFELYDIETGQVYYETGNYIAGTTEPPKYMPPAFSRLSHSVLKLNDPLLVGRRLMVRCYGPASKKFSPSALLTYDKSQDATVTNSIVWWDPARGVHHPEAYALVTNESRVDPAIYNQSLLGASTTDPTRAWGSQQVGKVWWDTSKAKWLPYSDTKLYTDIAERTAMWGGVADHGEICMHEWVESSVHPSKWNELSEAGITSGKVSIANHVYRDRIWYVRPIMWATSKDPATIAHAAEKLGVTELKLVNNEFIYASTGVLPTFVDKERISLAMFTSSTKNATTFSKPNGMAVINGALRIIAGSTSNPTTPTAPTSVYANSYAVKVTSGAVKSGEPLQAQVTFSVETEEDTVYLRATLEGSGSIKSQRVGITDAPVNAATMLSFDFNTLGFTITCKSMFSRTASWPVIGTTTAIARCQALLEEIASYNLYMRPVYDVEVLVPFSQTTLPALTAPGTVSWVSWIEPSVSDLKSDNEAPFNKLKPYVGDWVKLDGTYLPRNRANIKRTHGLLDEKQPYKQTWSAWTIDKPLELEMVYSTLEQSHVQAMNLLTFEATREQAEAARMYINGKLYLGAKSLVNVFGTKWFINAPSTPFKDGYIVTVVVDPVKPTSLQLNLNLTDRNTDPSILREWKIELPHVMVETRAAVGTPGIKKYYFWVRGKEQPPIGKTISCAQAEAWLRTHPGQFAVPQVYKFANQLDGRPNRYGLLSVRGLTWAAPVNDTYKLRLKRIPFMRNDDEDVTLKQVHQEWSLIRANQPTKLPKALWDKLVDTLCGEVPPGDELPSIALTDYDGRSAIIPASWGLGPRQALCPPGIARATVQATLLSPRALKYDATQQKMVPDVLDYTGFDITALATYFETPESIRQLMADIWTFGSARQVNELFFEVLEDSLAYTRELEGIFKTSYIAVDDVRTVSATITDTANFL